MDVRQSRPRSVRSDRTTKDETPVGWCAMLRPADVKCERSVAVAIATLLLRLSRHACADRPMPWSKHLRFTMTTGKPLSVAMVTITFVYTDVNNTVTWTLIASSVCVREQCKHMDCERIVRYNNLE